MCDGKCNCKTESKIETIWVEPEVGEQLKFAVGEDGLNETSKIDELRTEISDFFIGIRGILIKNYGQNAETIVSIHDMYSKEIMGIIEKYR